MIYQSFNYYLHIHGDIQKSTNFTTESQLKCNTRKPHDLFTGLLKVNVYGNKCVNALCQTIGTAVDVTVQLDLDCTDFT